MRFLFLLCVALFGFAAYREYVQPRLNAAKKNDSVPAQTADTNTNADEEKEPAEAVPVAAVKEFRSLPEAVVQTVAPKKAPEGVYYLRERISIVSDHGVLGIPAGSELHKEGESGVQWKMRYKDQTVDVSPIVLTNDLDVVEEIRKELAAKAQPDPLPTAPVSVAVPAAQPIPVSSPAPQQAGMDERARKAIDIKIATLRQRMHFNSAEINRLHLKSRTGNTNSYRAIITRLERQNQAILTDIERLLLQQNQ